MEYQNQNYHQRNTSKTQMVPQNPYYRPNSSQFLAPVSASIPRYCFDNDKYWYIIEAVMEDGRHWELSRYYHDFYDFQIALLAEFPEEAGNSDTGKPRTLPFMPGPVTHVTDAISNGRRHNLDEYIKKLLSMPPHISRCDIVRLLFAPREGDFEIDPNAAGEDYRLSGTSQQSSQNHDPSRTASRQSSRGQMTSVNGGSVYPAGVPVQSRNQLQRGAQSMSGPNPNGQSYLQNPSSSDLNLRQQASTLTQGSTNSSQGPVNSNAGGALKIKIFFQDDIIAIRVPSDISFPQLREKLKDRLKVNEEIAVQYRDEMTGSYGELLNDQDLDVALQRNPKLTLYVSFA
jgi:bud emergence protein 1